MGSSIHRLSVLEELFLWVSLKSGAGAQCARRADPTTMGEPMLHLQKSVIFVHCLLPLKNSAAEGQDQCDKQVPNGRHINCHVEKHRYEVCGRPTNWWGCMTQQDSCARGRQNHVPC